MPSPTEELLQDILLELKKLNEAIERQNQRGLVTRNR